MSTKHGSLSPQCLKRIQGGELILQDYDNEEIATIVGVTDRTVRRWRQKLKDKDDVHVLSRKKGSGRPTTLTNKQKQRLKRILRKGARKAGYPVERWTSKIVADLIQKTFDVAMAPRTVRSLLPTLGFSPQKPVVKSHKHSDEAVVEWAARTWKRLKKKCKKLGITLILWDESGFSMSPICGTTWAEVGKPTVLREIFSRNTQTGLGFITMTPEQRRLNFRFTIFSGAINTRDVIFYLTEIHRHYGKKVMIIFDRLPAHLAAQNFFEQEHPDWFVFEYFPSYSPESNPVEQCWQMMKNVYLANFVPLSIEHLTEKTLEVAQLINKDPKLLASFFHHAKLKL